MTGVWRGTGEILEDEAYAGFGPSGCFDFRILVGKFGTLETKGRG